MGRGKLIVIEGVDGSGKGIQVTGLASWLQEQRIPVRICRQPSNEFIGMGIRRGDLPVADLPWVVAAKVFAADRAIQGIEIEKALAEGDWVIADRYWPSGLVYSLARAMTEEKGEYAAEGWECDFLRKLEWGIPEMDLAVVLDVEEEVVRERLKDRKGAKGVTGYDSASWLTQVIALYRKLGELCPRDPVVVVKGGGAPVEVHELVVSQVKKLVGPVREVQW